MSFCPGCGSPTDGGDAFCGACGMRLSPVQATAQPSPSTPVDDPASGDTVARPGAPPPAGATQPGAGRRRPRRVLVVAGAVAIALVVGAAVIGVVFLVAPAGDRPSEARASAAGTPKSDPPVTVVTTRPATTTTTTTTAPPPRHEFTDTPSVGQCLDDTSPDNAYEFEVLACEAPHKYEVAGVVSHEHGPGEPYPGDAAFQSDSYDSPCDDSLYDHYLGADVWSRDDLDSYEFYPSEEEWADGTSTSLCTVVKADGSPLTGGLGTTVA